MAGKGNEGKELGRKGQERREGRNTFDVCFQRCSCQSFILKKKLSVFIDSRTERRKYTQQE